MSYVYQFNQSVFWKDVSWKDSKESVCAAGREFNSSQETFQRNNPKPFHEFSNFVFFIVREKESMIAMFITSVFSFTLQIIRKT